MLADGRTIKTKQQADETKKKKLKTKKKSKKPDFDFSILETLPCQIEIDKRQSVEKQQTKRFRPPPKIGLVKQGHWVSAMQRMLANHRDHSAKLATTVRPRSGDPPGLPRSGFRLESTRPVSLPKGQNKYIESIFLIPYHGEGDDGPSDLGRPPIAIVSRLRHRLAGSDLFSKSQAFRQMAASEFFFYVLARRPGDYQFLVRLPSTKVVDERSDGFDSQETYYRIVLPPSMGDRLAPVTLPANPLTWTSIAYLLWDDVEPDRLALQQQRALVDWLHWGGELIISGPGSLELLKGSFLEPYLPATAGGSREITAEALAEVNRRFAQNGKLFSPSSGIELKLHREANAIDQTGGLLYERRAGRGRVVVSAFRLATAPSQRTAHNKAYDRFFASCILGRDTTSTTPGERSAREICQLRYFSRDSGDWIAEREQPGLSEIEPSASEEEQDKLSAAFNGVPFDELAPARKFGPGVAGWSDFSPVAQAARESLREAAGIKVPDAGFVVRLLSIYLVVLVPVNWLFFRLIRRVEWAWAAAPVIATICAMVVINQAQLDIGFARARTEFAIVETQNGFSRAHVTRYTALYTSLSTGYEVVLQDPQALITPFSKGDNFRRLLGQEPVTVGYHLEGGQIRLSGFQVASNSTDWLHSEQMVELGGTINSQTIASGKLKIANTTNLSLESVAVIKSVEKDSFQVAWIGDFGAHTSTEIEFRAADAEHLVEQQWRAAAHVSGDNTSKSLNLRRLLEVALHPADYRVGDVRLIGWTSQPVEGMSVEPTDSQSSYATLVITHLRHGKRLD